MSVPVLITIATIEEYGKGKIGEIIFESYGSNRDYTIICPKKLAYVIGRDMCDYRDKITIDDITWACEDALEDIKCEINQYLTEYIENNYDGEYIE